MKAEAEIEQETVTLPYALSGWKILCRAVRRPGLHFARITLAHVENTAWLGSGEEGWNQGDLVQRPQQLFWHQIMVDLLSGIEVKR